MRSWAVAIGLGAALLTGHGVAAADTPDADTQTAVKPAKSRAGLAAPHPQLLVADVGEVSWEELNLVTAGGNYGWWPGEGHCADCGYVNPIYAYQRDGLGAALTSVLVYTGSTFDPSFRNKVFIADWARGWIKVLTCEDDYSSCGNAKTFDADAGSTVSLLQGPDGVIYQLTYDTFIPGTISRIAPVGS